MAELSNVTRFAVALRELDLARVSESEIGCSSATIDNLVDQWGIPDDAQSTSDGVLIFIWRDLPGNAPGSRFRNERFAYPLDRGCLVFATDQDVSSIGRVH